MKTVCVCIIFVYITTHNISNLNKLLHTQLHAVRSSEIPATLKHCSCCWLFWLFDPSYRVVIVLTTSALAPPFVSRSFS